MKEKTRLVSVTRCKEILDLLLEETMGAMGKYFCMRIANDIRVVGVT